MRLGNESKRYDPREEAMSRETCTGRGTVFEQFPFTIVAASRQRASTYAGVHQITRQARVMHTFREFDAFRDTRKSAAVSRTYPLLHLRVLVKRSYFFLFLKIFY